MVNSDEPENDDKNFNPYGYLDSSWENAFVVIKHGEQEWVDMSGATYFWGSIILSNDDGDHEEGVAKQDTDDVDDFNYLGES